MLTREWLNAFVPIGVMRSQNDWLPLGAGALFHDPPVVWLITANHIVERAKGEGMTLLVTRAKGGPTPVKIREIQQKHGYGWHSDEMHDIAATLMPLSPDWRIKAIGEDMCIKWADLVPSMPCFTVGCPYGVTGFDPQRATPLVLDGIISGLNPDSGQIYTSVPTFPGNSGGPIIVRRDPFDPGGGLTVGRPVLLLAGIIRQFGLVPPLDSSGEVSLPPLHLGVGASIEAAIALVRSPSAREERERVLAKQAAH